MLLRGEGKDFIGGYKVVSTRRKGNFISQDAGNFIHEDGRGGGTSPLASAIAANERKSEGKSEGGGSAPHLSTHTLSPCTPFSRPPLRPHLLSHPITSEAGTSGSDYQAHTVYAVRAVTDVQVLVLDATDMKWAVDHDYRLETELHKG